MNVQKPKRAGTSFFNIEIKSNPSLDVAEPRLARLANVISVMKPVASPVPLVRIGGKGDGGYLLPHDLDGIFACFSPGVSNRKDFEDDLAVRFGIGSHLCDRSSDPDRFRTPLKSNQTFKKVWLDVEDGPESITLESWINELAPDPRDDLLLQIDIEGAEYRNILATRPEVLARFRIIVIEVHRLDMFVDENVFESVFRPFFEKIGASFRCIHAHPNNARPAIELPDLGLNLPQIMELTFLRKDRFDLYSGLSAFPPESPHPLDSGRNVSARAPVFLSDAWLPAPRSIETRLRMAEDELDYLRRVRAQELQSQGFESGSQLARCFEIANSLRRSLAQTSRGDLSLTLSDNLAEGKRYVLSTHTRNSQKTGVVGRKTPSFFETRTGTDQFIEIDLEKIFEIHQIQIENRRGNFQNRAKHLVCILRDGIDDSQICAFPLEVSPGFLDGKEPFSYTDIPLARARYIKITSLSETALHFANIRIFGREIA